MDSHASLLELIYAGVEDDEPWTDALAQIAKSLRAAGAGIGLQDMATHEFRAVAQAGIDAELSHVYSRFAPENRVWQTIARTGRPLTDMMVMPKPEFVRTPLYSEWFAPQRFHSVMAAPVLASGTGSGVVVTFGAKRRDFETVDLERLAGLAPHIGRALRLRSDRVRIMDDLQAQQRLLDELPDGILIVDANLRVQYANLKARAVLARNDALRLRDGVVCCRESRSQAELLGTTKASCTPGAPAGGWLAVPQPNRRSLFIEVMQLRCGQGGQPRSAAFAIRIRDPDRQRAPTALQLQRLLGLTLGEAKAVLAIARTSNQHEAARRLGRARTTLRTHLHHAYDKLGVHDPADLARLLAAYGFAQAPVQR